MSDSPAIAALLAALTREPGCKRLGPLTRLGVMSDDVTPFRRRRARVLAGRPAGSAAADPVAGARDRRRLVAGDASGLRARAVPVLADGVRVVGGAGPAQPVPAVPDPHRRPRRSLRARPLAPPRRDPAGHDPRLARLGGGVPQGDRAADRPGGVRRGRRRRVPRGLPDAARLRVQRQAGPPGVGRRADRRRVGPADGPPRLPALRRAGRRLGVAGGGGARPAAPRERDRGAPQHGDRLP